MIYRAFADLHGCLDLITATETFIEFNFADVVEGEEFLSLTVQEVIVVIINLIIQLLKKLNNT